MTRRAVRWLNLQGHQPYRPIEGVQRYLAEQCRATKHDTVLFLEHEPVYSFGRRQSLSNHVDAVQSQRALLEAEADVVLSKRGGLVTYHGPGQLVTYLVVDLQARQWKASDYVHALEQSLVSVLASYGIPSFASTQHTGIWTSKQHKIASIGIHVDRGIASHGFALNVTNEPLPWFQKIVACGIEGVQMTSMQDYKKAQNGSFAMQDVKEKVQQHLLTGLFQDTEGSIESMQTISIENLLEQ